MFRFDEGDRASSAMIDHAQLVQLVQEAVPFASIDELWRTRKTAFQHAAAAGVLVRVLVDAVRGTEWSIIVRPDGDGGALALETDEDLPSSPGFAAPVPGLTPARPATRAAPAVKITGGRSAGGRSAVERRGVSLEPVEG